MIAQSAMVRRGSPAFANASARGACVPERQGFALFAALWLVVAIGVVALQFSLEARERRFAAANTVEFAEARAAAMGGIDHAHARLDRMLRDRALRQPLPATLRAADPWLDADTLVALVADGDGEGEPEGLRYDVRVRDVNSFLNINTAGENQLRLFFTRLGFDYGISDELAQSILDWRDTDANRRTSGAEREAYLTAGRLVLPRDAAFQELDELQHVMHMTREIYDSVRPFLTARGNGQINVNSAPEPVLASATAMTDAAIASIMILRSSGRRITTQTQLRSLIGGSGTGSPAPALGSFIYDTRNLLVMSTGYNRGARSPFQVEALITRSGDASTSTVSWRRSR